MNIRNFTPTVKRTYKDLKEFAWASTHAQEAMEKSPVVNLGWQRKGTDGKLEEAKLPLAMYKMIAPFSKLTAGFFVVATPVSLAKAVTDEMAILAEGKANITSNILKARTTSLAEDSIVFDTKIPLPIKLYNATKNESTHAGRFLKSMKQNKDSLMKDLNISSDEYNEYAVMALKICKEESQFGNATSYKLYDMAEKSEFGRDAISTVRKVVKGDEDLSLGMTRFKINKASDEEKVLFDKYGVTYNGSECNIIEPEQSAIASIIHLATLGKDYPKYLENARALRPNLNDKNVQESLERAKQILFNDTERAGAIYTLQHGKKDAIRAGYYPGFLNSPPTQRDLNDLRLFASTVILSKESYLAGRWNGRKLLPEGKKADQACANLLNVAAQKGYMANINKKSEVLY